MKWNRRVLFYSHDYNENITNIDTSLPRHVFRKYWIDLCCSLATRTHTRCLQAIASQISLGWCLLRTRSTLPVWRFYCTSIGLASEPFIKTSRDTLWWVFEILSKCNGMTHAHVKWTNNSTLWIISCNAIYKKKKKKRKMFILFRKNDTIKSFCFFNNLQSNVLIFEKLQIKWNTGCFDKIFYNQFKNCL